jgi:alpha-N-arabinofuranosidase
MLPEYNADLNRRYAIYCRNNDENRLNKIAIGASDYDYNWTEVLMKKIGYKMDAISLHYYTVTGWRGSKGSATLFSPDDYYRIVGKCAEIEEVINKHIAIMDKYDAQKRIALLVDEWGTWFDEEPETVRGHLFQQNTMRDAFVAALSLNIFNKYSDRIQMANIAQVANVLQSMVLTKEDKMVVTPTYHVFEMYKVHQDAKLVPLSISSNSREIRGRNIALTSASASVKDGITHITLANISLDLNQEIDIYLGQKFKNVSAKILTSKNINDHNTFDNPETVKPADFKDFKISGDILKIKMPAKSIIALEIK